MEIDKIYGAPATALKIAEKRASVIASNLVNGNTPNYKAKDIDFKSILKNQSSQLTMSSTSGKHIAGNSQLGGLSTYERPDSKESLNGNTVDGDKERAAFMNNSIRYKANLSFIRGTHRTLMSALKGN